jgi:hypothetical protein
MTLLLRSRPRGRRRAAGKRWPSIRRGCATTDDSGGVPALLAEHRGRAPPLSRAGLAPRLGAAAAPRGPRPREGVAATPRGPSPEAGSSRRRMRPMPLLDVAATQHPRFPGWTKERLKTRIRGILVFFAFIFTDFEFFNSFIPCLSNGIQTRVDG